MTPPVLRDPTRRLRVGPALTAETTAWFVMGATSIVYSNLNGGVRGVFVDDETPGRVDVALALRKEVPPTGLVVVGHQPDQGHRAFLERAGCIVALVWYPWAYDFEPYPLPRAQAYFTQWDYCLPGQTPPTPEQRKLLYRRAWLKLPSKRLVWVY